MTTIAKKVKQIVEAKCPGTFSLYAGYGMEAGNQVRFPGGVLLSEKRNDKGRMTRAVYKYADDSQLVYTYMNERYTLSVK